MHNFWPRTPLSGKWCFWKSLLLAFPKISSLMPLNRQEWDEILPHGTICFGLSSSSCEPGKSSEGLCVGGGCAQRRSLLLLCASQHSDTEQPGCVLSDSSAGGSAGQPPGPLKTFQEISQTHFSFESFWEQVGRCATDGLLSWGGLADLSHFFSLHFLQLYDPSSEEQPVPIWDPK